jgi:hypothetical protein
MKTLGFTVAITAAGVLFSIATAQAASLSEQVRGTSWHLVTLTATLPDGKSIYPVGPKPSGYTIFDRTGHFITVTENPDVPKFASPNPLKATDAEQRVAWQGGRVDFGTYKVDEKNHMLIMHVEGSDFPNWVGTDIHNVTALEGNRMTWSKEPGSDKVPVVLVWERMR